MGTLVARHYPTKLFLQLADHTYVECGNGGKGWSCWGGKTGGALLRQGPGSTKRADAIAGPKERAGITCYLINGVCHQAANRILLPARITVRGARGYGVSEALFGTYGRPRGFFGLCKAPFHQHPNVQGDLPECQAGGPGPTSSAARGEDDPGYLDRVLGTYQDAEKGLASARGFDADEWMGFQLRLFSLQIEHRLEGGIQGRRGPALLDIRRSFESARREFEEPFEKEKLGPQKLVEAFEKANESFQNGVANVLEPGEYQALFDAERGDIVKLADPAAFGGTATAE
jgi:hypothetical protein